MLSIQKFFVSGLMLSQLTAQAGANSYQLGEYKVDTTHSKVGFEVPHLVISSVEGKFTKVDGQITLEKDFLKSRVIATAQTDSIDTGVKDRDDHLKSADFFDVKNNSEIIFKSNSLKGKPDSFKMTGDLTIKGITKKVTFDSQLLGNVKDAFGNERAAFKASASISRKDFGLTWNKLVEVGPIVGDKIKIELKIQGIRAQQLKAASK